MASWTNARLIETAVTIKLDSQTLKVHEKATIETRQEDRDWKLFMYNVDAIAVRLADEGVPLRAIARATNTPSDQLRTKLREARDEGRLLDLPKEDWPPGFPRDQRALQLSVW